jgi:hypothetical protein
MIINWRVRGHDGQSHSSEGWNQLMPELIEKLQAVKLTLKD